MLGKIKKGFNIFLEVVFYIAYIVTIILGILDIFDLVNLFNMEQWMKILVMLFGTIGIVVLGDKRKMEQDFIPNISEISNTQNDLFTEEQKIKESVSNIENKVSGNSEVFYFSDKTQFYLFLTDLLLKLPTNARIDVTSFEKNYNISYSVGEDVHIEAFMTAWTQAVRSGKFHVRQLVHVTSPQDYNELKDRVYSFKDNWNYTISAMVGMPIAPFSDYIILNQEYVVIGMSNDISCKSLLSAKKSG